VWWQDDIRDSTASANAGSMAIERGLDAPLASNLDLVDRFSESQVNDIVAVLFAGHEDICKLRKRGSKIFRLKVGNKMLQDAKATTVERDTQGQRLTAAVRQHFKMWPE
jgi:hypothetical protein